jgi:TRAF3-interacting protein 1
MTTGVEIKANPLKIVAGLEPEETNVLLQMLGKMVIKKVNVDLTCRQILQMPFLK